MQEQYKHPFNEYPSNERGAAGRKARYDLRSRQALAGKGHPEHTASVPPQFTVDQASIQKALHEYRHPGLGRTGPAEWEAILSDLESLQSNPNVPVAVTEFLSTQTAAIRELNPQMAEELEAEAAAAQASSDQEISGAELWSLYIQSATETFVQWLNAKFPDRTDALDAKQRWLLVKILLIITLLSGGNTACAPIINLLLGSPASAAPALPDTAVPISPIPPTDTARPWPTGIPTNTPTDRPLSPSQIAQMTAIASGGSGGKSPESQGTGTPPSPELSAAEKLISGIYTQAEILKFREQFSGGLKLMNGVYIGDLLYNGIGGIDTKTGITKLVALKFANSPDYVKLSSDTIEQLSKQLVGRGDEGSCFEHVSLGTAPITDIEVISTGIPFSEDIVSPDGKVAGTMQSILAVTCTEGGKPRLLKFLVQIENSLNPRVDLLENVKLMDVGYDYGSTTVHTPAELSQAFSSGKRLSVLVQKRWPTKIVSTGGILFRDRYMTPGYLADLAKFLDSDGTIANATTPLLVFATSEKLK